MAFKIKKEWIPEKYKKDISNPPIVSEDKSGYSLFSVGNTT